MDDLLEKMQAPETEITPSIEIQKMIAFEYDEYALYPDDIWQRVRRNSQLNLSIDNPAIQKQLATYLRHPSYIDKMVSRSSRYIYFIMGEIEKRGIPSELALLPIVESAFDPFAYSHGAASGMWQFIPGTGKEQGLQQDWWYDGRRDVIASTNAALDYLTALTRYFKGDWMLGLAAYNSGAGTVQKAIRKNKKLGEPTDFWSLSLPKETQDYVPKLIAISKIFQDPNQYDVDLHSVASEPYFAQVETHSQIDLAQAAKMAQTDLDEIYKLNPGFNRWATSPNGPHQLLVPIAKKEIFEQALIDLPPQKRIAWVHHTIKAGDTVSSLAVKYSSTKELIREYNSLANDKIRLGKTLLIPTASQKSSLYVYSESNRIEKKQARHPKNTMKFNHVVKSGDSFWSLSQKFNVGVQSIAKWNGLAPSDTLRLGQKLVIWKKSNDSRAIIKKIRYTIRNGDSLFAIALKFNVTLDNIKKWNQPMGKYLQPKQVLTLYINVNESSQN
ncbi:MAG: LysM peptidoglycan-binding domain-containing protein [Saccharospirillaceae bacterium]|nr:LysM peptidoglycan-binding domain-containing protein [Saccharospirillaceae bacterium]